MDRQQPNLKQIFSPILIHQEEEPNVTEINESTADIADDISNIDAVIIESATKLKNLINNTKIRLSSIKEYLNAEKERQEDMNILCNRYTEFSSVISLTRDDFGGNLTYENGIVSAKLKSYEKLQCEVVDVNGNGYQGNSYVYTNNDFLKNSLDSSDKDSMVDNNVATYYEYSRITVNDSINGAPNLFNKDSIEAECSIELKANNHINKLLIYSDRNDIILSKVFTSQDGLTYKLDKEYEVAMNERYERYNNQEYVYGSGVLAIEPAPYVRLYFRSNGYTNDTIAFINNFYSDVGGSSSIIKKIEKVDSAKRHVVKINEISAYKNKYEKGYLISKELVNDQINTIALYCNEYINKDYTIENNVSYFLIINGVEHEICPINSHREGKKIIKMTTQSYKLDHVTYLNESIKSAKLKIVINSANQDITPYISDIKILIGGNNIE
jgi:hypothetical protein